MDLAALLRMLYRAGFTDERTAWEMARIALRESGSSPDAHRPPRPGSVPRGGGAGGSPEL